MPTLWHAITSTKLAQKEADNRKNFIQSIFKTDGYDDRLIARYMKMINDADTTTEELIRFTAIRDSAIEKQRTDACLQQQQQRRDGPYRYEEIDEN